MPSPGWRVATLRQSWYHAPDAATGCTLESSKLLTWTLRAIARAERNGLRPPRLTEPNHERWHRVRRKLGWVAFIELLHEDLASSFPTCMDLSQWETHPTRTLDEPTAAALVDRALRPDDSDRPTFLRNACRDLGLMDGGNIAPLPKVQPHQRALELPGCGGRIAAHQVLSHENLGLDSHFTFVADTDIERVAIGLTAFELRANPPTVLTSAELLSTRPRFDVVFGSSSHVRAPHPSTQHLATELGHDVRWA